MRTRRRLIKITGKDNCKKTSLLLSKVEMLEFIEKIKMDSFQECIIQCFQNKESKEEKIENLNQAIYYCNIAKENIAKENRIIQNNKIIYGYKKRHCVSLMHTISLYIEKIKLPIIYKDIIFYITQYNYENAIKLIEQELIEQELIEK